MTPSLTRHGEYCRAPSRRGDPAVLLSSRLPPDLAGGRSAPSMPQKPAEPTRPLSLTTFVDRLLHPPVLRPAPSRPGAYATLRVRMRAARVRLHLELPPTEVW